MATRKLIIGCGYLGERVARRWLAVGDSVFALTRSPDRATEWRGRGIEALVGDVTIAPSLAALPEVDTLLFAVGLDRSSGKSQRDVYVGGLENVLGCMAGRARQILYISSTGVYGQDDGSWVDESSDCRPVSEGGKVCLEAESLLRAKAAHANVLRLGGIYGPGRLIGRIGELRAGRIQKGNPEAWLNLIHVEDVVAAVLACERRGTPGKMHIVCDDRPCRRREFYSLLAWLIGAPQPQFDLHLEPGLNKCCSNRRLREELNVVLRFPSMRVGLPDALTTRTGFGQSRV